MWVSNHSLQPDSRASSEALPDAFRMRSVVKASRGAYQGWDALVRDHAAC